MPSNEKTGKTIGSIASKGLKDPGSLSKGEIKSLAASALTQAPDKPARPAPKAPPKRK